MPRYQSPFVFLGLGSQWPGIPRRRPRFGERGLQCALSLRWARSVRCQAPAAGDMPLGQVRCFLSSSGSCREVGHLGQPQSPLPHPALCVLLGGPGWLPDQGVPSEDTVAGWHVPQL